MSGGENGAKPKRARKGKMKHGIRHKTNWKRYKCSGFYGYRLVRGKIYDTGSSFFTTIEAKYLSPNSPLHVEIKKHFPHVKYSLWDAKRFMNFMIKNFPDYLREDRPTATPKPAGEKG